MSNLAPPDTFGMMDAAPPPPRPFQLWRSSHDENVTITVHGPDGITEHDIRIPPMDQPEWYFRAPRMLEAFGNTDPMTDFSIKVGDIADPDAARMVGTDKHILPHEGMHVWIVRKRGGLGDSVSAGGTKPRSHAGFPLAWRRARRYRMWRDAYQRRLTKRLSNRASRRTSKSGKSKRKSKSRKTPRRRSGNRRSGGRKTSRR